MNLPLRSSANRPLIWGMVFVIVFVVGGTLLYQSIRLHDSTQYRLKVINGVQCMVDHQNNDKPITCNWNGR